MNLFILQLIEILMVVFLVLFILGLVLECGAYTSRSITLQRIGIILLVVSALGLIITILIYISVPLINPLPD